MSPKRRVLSTAVHGAAAVTLAFAGEMARHYEHTAAMVVFFAAGLGAAIAARWLPR